MNLLVTTVNKPEHALECPDFLEEYLHSRRLIIASNRGPVSFNSSLDHEVQFHRSSGGLVTALTGLSRYADVSWIASSATEGDREWGEGEIILGEDSHPMRICFLNPAEQAYEYYYNHISNPLLWFLQHMMWDLVRSPTIDSETWRAWEEGYVVVNRMFAEAIFQEIHRSDKPCLVMLQDYHLYLVPHFLRREYRNRRKYALTMFIHIPWPGPEDWAVLPPRMRRSILESLCDLDMVGLQTQEDGLNLLRTAESFLPEAHVNYRHGRIWYRNRATHVRDFPISIDVQALRELAGTEEVQQLFQHLKERWGSRQLIVRVDRTEPSKNIVRGFMAFDELLALHPEHRGKVQFLALLVPSRIEVTEYQGYLDELMAAAGRVNVKYGDSEWEPVRILVGNNYARAVAALQLYDVLLVNSLADGMNLVAKEGPIVNQKDGVVILSERTGARQQLEIGSIVIPPIDIYATAEAIHQALVMPQEERQEKASRLIQTVEREDIFHWLCSQLQEIIDLDI